MDFEPQLKLGLQNMWYPICQSAGVKEKPRGFHRLGQDVVVWRDSVGKIHIHEDRCLHRGAKLSVGEVVNGSLRCAYDGWCYDTSGQCVTIPTSKTAQTKLAPRLRLRSYESQERADLVWGYFSENATSPAGPGHRRRKRSWARLRTPKSHRASNATSPRCASAGKSWAFQTYIGNAAVGDYETSASN